MPRDSHHDPGPAALFPGWRWVAVALAFPVVGLIGWTVGGRVDGVAAALVGGALTGAGLGAVQWWAANGCSGARRPGSAPVPSATPPGWRPAPRWSARHRLGDLAAMGAVSGLVLGAAQGLALAVQAASVSRWPGRPRCRRCSRSDGAPRRRVASASKTSSPSSAPTAQWCSRCSADSSWRASPAFARTWRDGPRPSPPRTLLA